MLPGGGGTSRVEFGATSDEGPFKIERLRNPPRQGTTFKSRERSYSARRSSAAFIPLSEIAAAVQASERAIYAQLPMAGTELNILFFLRPLRKICTL